MLYTLWDLAVIGAVGILLALPRTSEAFSLLSLRSSRSSRIHDTSSSHRLLPADPAETVETNDEMSLYDKGFCAIDFDDIYQPYTSPLYSESTFVEYTEDGLCVPAGPIGRFKESLANTLAEPIVEVMIAASVLLNSLLVALSTLDSLESYKDLLRDGELFVSVIFGVDFLGRWYSSSKDTGKHIWDAQFALDVVVVMLPLLVGVTPASVWDETPLPSAITSPSGLFNLELLRVLRLRRVLKDLGTFERFTERALLGTAKRQTVNKLVQEWQLQLARVLLSLFTLISVATGLVYTAESSVNPSINNYFDALYFGLTTLTTVGFGDIVVVTAAGKLVVCGAILVGVAVVPAQAAALVEALLEREDQKRRFKKQSNRMPSPIGSSSGGTDSVISMNTEKTCSACGANFHWVGANYCYSCGADLGE